jgi:hypothetical protein
MNKSIIKILATVFLGAVIFISCTKRNYIIGGSLSNPKVNMTTYDYLQGNSLHMFDTVMQLVDKAGLKDLINQPGATFFAPTNHSVYAYLNARTIEMQKIDPNAKYTLDTLYKYDLDRVRDSLKMYIVNAALTYDKMTNNGTKYVSDLSGDTVVVSYENTTDGSLGYNSVVSSVPQVVYFTQLWYPLWEPFQAGNIPNNIGVHTLCQTSGVQTTNGILNVLNSSHTLFFYGTKK